MTELHWLGVRELARAYATRRLSPVELVQALLRRIERHDPALNSFIRLDAEDILAQAREAERAIMAGRCLSPLHGVPVGLKDMIDVAGVPTTCHSKIMLDHVAPSDAAVVGKLRQAGAIVFGKLACQEFGWGGHSWDLPFPLARNPWNRDHHPGGSSSGSAAAVAAGFLPLALGTDSGGSVRNPASSCGLVGVKATYGLVSRRGAFPLAYTLDHIGPLARSVEDAALLLDAIAGHDALDPGSAPSAARSATADLHRDIAGLHIGFVRHFHEQDMIADPEMAAALEQVADTLRREGAAVADCRLPPLREFAGVNRTILLAEAWAVHAPWIRHRPEDYGRIMRSRAMAGAFISGGDYVQAQRRRLELIAAVDDVLRKVDVLLIASAMDPPCRIDDPVEEARTYARQARLPFNVTGHPAAVAMCGLTRSGLPLSAQFVGPAFDETTVMRVVAAYERVTDWHTRRPQL